MKDENIVYNYFVGNMNYYLLLREYIYDEKNDPIINKKTIDAVKVGCISNIMLATKEDLIDKKANLTYESKIIIEELEKCANIISKKTKNGYMLGNIYFKDAATLISILRNKIAHGLFQIDFDYSNLIFDIKEKKVKISIDKLTSFIVQALMNYLDRSNPQKFKRMFVISNKFDKRRKNPINTMEEVKEFVKSMSKLDIEIVPKLGYSINKKIKEQIEIALKIFSKTNNFDILLDLQNKLKNEYDVKYSVTPIDKKSVNKLSVFLFNITPTNEEYYLQIHSYLSEATRVLDKRFEKSNLILSNAKNLIFINTIEREKVLNKKEIIQKIVELYNEVYLNYDQLAASTISMFTSLFSYPMEDLYDNPNLFKTGPTLGLDYSQLDLSLLNVENYTIDNSSLKKLFIEHNSIKKDIDRVKENLNKNKISLLEVKGKENIENKIKAKISLLLEKLDLLNNKYLEKKKKMVFLMKYALENYEYLENKAIIEGIRNSISHGNYRIEIGTSMEDSLMVFEDIYDGKVTFKATTTISDFASICIKNANYIFYEANDKKKIK